MGEERRWNTPPMVALLDAGNTSTNVLALYTNGNLY